MTYKDIRVYDVYSMIRIGSVLYAIFIIYVRHLYSIPTYTIPGE